MMRCEGQAICYGDHVDTDVIIPARYLNTSDAQELARHCLEDLDPQFVKKVTPGAILCAGVNFGCGSSREHAPLAIKSAGIACVVAKSFARIFYRNAINIGLPIVACDLEIAEGDRLIVDFAGGQVQNVTRATAAAFAPFAPFLQRIIQKGGLLAALREGLE